MQAMAKHIAKLAGGFRVLPVQNREEVYYSSMQTPRVIMSRPETGPVHLTPDEARALGNILIEAADVSEVVV